MKRTLIIAAALSAAATLAACDRGTDTATAPGAPSADGSVTMPSPAPENTAPPAGSPGTLGGDTGTMGGDTGTGTMGGTTTTP